MLSNNRDGLTNIYEQPCARISLFRAEVKDRCNTVSVAAFYAMGSAPEIARVVQKQLSHYTYTFPSANVSPKVVLGSMLTSTTGPDKALTTISK